MMCNQWYYICIIFKRQWLRPQKRYTAAHSPHTLTGGGRWLVVWLTWLSSRHLSSHTLFAAEAIWTSVTPPKKNHPAIYLCCIQKHRRQQHIDDLSTHKTYIATPAISAFDNLWCAFGGLALNNTSILYTSWQTAIPSNGHNMHDHGKCIILFYTQNFTVWLTVSRWENWDLYFPE